MKANAQQPLYQRIADRMEEMIEAGSLRAGDRIPSVRHMSMQHQVSVPTVMQAYALLENRRLIEARPKSGFYVRARLANALREPVAVKRKPAVSAMSTFTSMLSIGRDMLEPSPVPFGGAVPGDALLPLEKLGQLSGAMARRYTHAATNYDPPPGCLPLRQELSRRSLDWGCGLDADDFMITLGASEAIQLALLATTQPGDTVLVEAPTYYGTLNLLAQLGRKVLAIPSSASEGMDLAAVNQALEGHRVAAILVIPNFSNPLGSLMPEANRKRLLELASLHRIPIIEDDIYGDIPHDGQRPRALKALDDSDQVILCGSFSKTLAPGFRIGYLAAGKYQQRVMELKTVFNLAGPALPALTVAEFLRNGGYDRHLRKLRHTYRQQVCRMRETVAEVFPEGTKVSNPGGGFVIWLELDEGVDVLAAFHEAKAAGISFAPGPLFSPDGQFGNCLRLSCGFPWNERMEGGLRTLAKIIGKAGSI
ncbi:MAG: PLP-dependent aminotransferase family protein [Luteolibacter sp.]